MKWIKASEQLPKTGDYIPCKMFGDYHILRFERFEEMWDCIDREGDTINQEYKPHIEWLDESDQPNSVQEGDKEAVDGWKDALNEAVDVIKQWHNNDEVWDIYFNHAPEMKQIRETLKPPQQ